MSTYNMFSRRDKNNVYLDYHLSGVTAAPTLGWNLTAKSTPCPIFVEPVILPNTTFPGQA